jgi:hypothetical protein
MLGVPEVLFPARRFRIELGEIRERLVVPLEVDAFELLFLLTCETARGRQQGEVEAATARLVAEGERELGRGGSRDVSPLPTQNGDGI